MICAGFRWGMASEYQSGELAESDMEDTTCCDLLLRAIAKASATVPF